MISPGISYLPTEENVNFIKDVPLQISFFDYQQYEKHIENIIELKNKYNILVEVVHLPIRSTKEEFQKILDMIYKCSIKLGTKKFVIHPNKGILYFINLFEQSKVNVELCIENFQYRKKKELRSPLEIVERCHDNKNLRLTFDTSHAELEWFDYKIMFFLLKYTSVIHLSNKKDRQQHLPFSIQNGDLNLVAFISDLKRRYNWNGSIILEYMSDYHYKLLPNQAYLKKLLGSH